MRLNLKTLAFCKAVAKTLKEDVFAFTGRNIRVDKAVLRLTAAL
jgi:hypothetical protein